MYELKTSRAEDVLSFYNSVNKVKTKDDYIWQKILFSENVLTNTLDIWNERYDKVHMQSLQVLAMLSVESDLADVNDSIFYSDIIRFLISLKEKIAKIDVISARKMINEYLAEFLDNESVYVNNFADILFERVENLSNESLMTTFDDFITTNIFCFSLYDIQFCEGRVGIETYNEDSLPNSVLVKSAFGNLVLNNVIINNAKMILDLSSTMVKNKLKKEPVYDDSSHIDDGEVVAPKFESTEDKIPRNKNKKFNSPYNDRRGSNASSYEEKRVEVNNPATGRPERRNEQQKRHMPQIDASSREELEHLMQNSSPEGLSTEWSAEKEDDANPHTLNIHIPTKDSEPDKTTRDDNPSQMKYKEEVIEEKYPDYLEEDVQNTSFEEPDYEEEIIEEVVEEDEDVEGDDSYETVEYEEEEEEEIVEEIEEEEEYDYPEEEDTDVDSNEEDDDYDYEYESDDDIDDDFDDFEEPDDFEEEIEEIDDNEENEDYVVESRRVRKHKLSFIPRSRK